MYDEYDVVWAFENHVHALRDILTKRVNQRLYEGWELHGEMQILEDVPYLTVNNTVAVSKVAFIQPLKRSKETKKRIEEEREAAWEQHINRNREINEAVKPLGLDVRTNNTLLRYLKDPIRTEPFDLTEFAERAVGNEMFLYGIRNLGKVGRRLVTEAAKRFLEQQGKEKGDV